MDDLETMDAFDDLVEATILRDEVAEPVRLGTTYIQIGAPHYAPEPRAVYESHGWTLDQWLSPVSSSTTPSLRDLPAQPSPSTSVAATKKAVGSRVTMSQLPARFSSAS